MGYPRPSKTDMGAGNLEGVTAAQPEQKRAVRGGIIDGKPLLNAKAPGKMNENRSTSLRPRKK